MERLQRQTRKPAPEVLHEDPTDEQLAAHARFYHENASQRAREERRIREEVQATIAREKSEREV